MALNATADRTIRKTKLIGDKPIKEYHKLTCHCGAVEIELHLPEGVVNPRRCSCSICSSRGAITGTAKLDQLRVVKGEEYLTLYQFNTRIAKHYFCKICGIYTHHQRRSFPDQYGYNVARLEGVNVYELGVVPLMDGINHPCDRKSHDAT